MTSLQALVATVIVLAPAVAAAQAVTTAVQRGDGLYSAVFRTPQGSVTVHVSSDVAPGDTISGVVLAEPGGATPKEQDVNSGVLTGFVVDLQDQETKVSSRRYRWQIPAALRTGFAILLLRDSGGREVSRIRVPVEPIPATRPGAPAPAATVELPTEAQAGRPAVIRAPLDGSLEGKEVTVQEQPAELLAASPRRLVFRVPANATGPVNVRLRSNGVDTRGTMRVPAVRLAATSTQLLRGQTATLTITATGLRDLKEPAVLSLTNASADVVSVQGGNTQAIEIDPRRVQADGTFAVTRRLTGVRAGPFSIAARVVTNPLSQFDVAMAADRAMVDWQASTGVRIADDAQDLIARSVADARRPLEAILRHQQAQQADVRGVFDALVRHYCFDLRDEMILAGSRRSDSLARPSVFLAPARQPQPAPAAITSAEVRRWSFSDFLSRLASRLATQPVGYLFVSSQPNQAPITIDGQRKSEMTDRRFVTSVGNHVVVVARPGGSCRETITVEPFQTHVVMCGQ